MVSPRLRPAVPLPTSIDTRRLRQILAAQILTALVAWVLPALLLPPASFTALGLADPVVEQLLFIRLWGAVSFALVAGQTFAWRTPARHPGTLLVTIVADAMSSIAIVSVGAGGAFARWSASAEAYAWGSAVVMGAFAVVLTMTGQPLLRRLMERPRPGSVKVM
jgi:hypothetical protein